MSLRGLVPWKRGLVRRTEMDPFATLQNEINRVFEGFFDDSDLLQAPVAAAMQPKLDVSETDKAIHLAVELPGMAEKDIDVELTEDAVKIRGEKKDERESKDRSFHCMERTFGMFERVIPLPRKIDRGGVTATIKDGVLNVVLPKVEPTATHQKITVKGA